MAILLKRVISDYPKPRSFKFKLLFTRIMHHWNWHDPRRMLVNVFLLSTIFGFAGNVDLASDKGKKHNRRCLEARECDIIQSTCVWAITKFPPNPKGCEVA